MSDSEKTRKTLEEDMVLKKFRRRKIILIALTLVYLVIVDICFKYDLENFSVLISSVLMGGFFGGPIILILCLRECINTLVKLKFECEDMSNDKRNRSEIVKVKCLIWGLSIIVFELLRHTFLYITAYINRLERFITPIIVLIIIFLFWLLLLIWYETNLEILIKAENRKKNVRIYIWIILIILTVVGCGYANIKENEEGLRKFSENNNQVNRTESSMYEMDEWYQSLVKELNQKHSTEENT